MILDLSEFPLYGLRLTWMNDFFSSEITKYDPTRSRKKMGQNVGKKNKVKPKFSSRKLEKPARDREKKKIRSGKNPVISANLYHRCLKNVFAWY